MVLSWVVPINRIPDNTIPESLRAKEALVGVLYNSSLRGWKVPPPRVTANDLREKKAKLALVEVQKKIAHIGTIVGKDLFDKFFRFDLTKEQSPENQKNRNYSHAIDLDSNINAIPEGEDKNFLEHLLFSERVVEPEDLRALLERGADVNSVARRLQEFPEDFNWETPHIYKIWNLLLDAGMDLSKALDTSKEKILQRITESQAEALEKSMEEGLSPEDCEAESKRASSLLKLVFEMTDTREAPKDIEDIVGIEIYQKFFQSEDFDFKPWAKAIEEKQDINAVPGGGVDQNKTLLSTILLETYSGTYSLEDIQKLFDRGASLEAVKNRLKEDKSTWAVLLDPVKNKDQVVKLLQLFIQKDSAFSFGDTNAETKQDILGKLLKEYFLSDNSSEKRALETIFFTKFHFSRSSYNDLNLLKKAFNNIFFLYRDDDFSLKKEEIENFFKLTNLDSVYFPSDWIKLLKDEARRFPGTIKPIDEEKITWMFGKLSDSLRQVDNKQEIMLSYKAFIIGSMLDADKMNLEQELRFIKILLGDNYNLDFLFQKDFSLDTMIKEAASANFSLNSRKDLHIEAALLRTQEKFFKRIEALLRTQEESDQVKYLAKILELSKTLRCNKFVKEFPQHFLKSTKLGERISLIKNLAK